MLEIVMVVGISCVLLVTLFVAHIRGRDVANLERDLLHAKWDLDHHKRQHEHYREAYSRLNAERLDPANVLPLIRVNDTYKVTWEGQDYYQVDDTTWFAEDGSPLPRDVSKILNKRVQVARVRDGRPGGITWAFNGGGE